MRTVRSKAELREALLEPRRQGKRIGLVPTMGYFHEGHLSLMCRAGQDCDVVVVSLFVNPTQFGPNEDLEAYPRDEGRDAQLAAAEGVDLLWTPDVAEMYPEGFDTAVEVGDSLAGVLEGDPKHRGRSHFRGVTTVVAKLFNSVQPDVAYFGRKDAQQALVIERMTRDLDFPVEIEVLDHPRGRRPRAELPERLPLRGGAGARRRSIASAAGGRGGGRARRAFRRCAGRGRSGRAS